MTCPKCGSENVDVQLVTTTEEKKKRHSILWWIFVSWWLIPIKWLVFTLPALISKLFSRKRTKTVVHNASVALCKSCGHNWTLKKA